ncbi:hypothetical protein CS048_002948 [Escherichia coli]|nr:hypothetical protein [Escherichia coli]
MISKSVYNRFMIQICFMQTGLKMKCCRLMTSLMTVIGTQLLAGYANADRIIQRPTGDFFIVSNKEAAQVFDRNNFGFFVLPPSPGTPVDNRIHSPKKYKSKAAIKTLKNTSIQCVPVKCPVSPVKPVTTIEPAESIFLRLEKMK